MLAATAGSEHVALSFAPDQGELLAQRLIRPATGGQRRHFQKRGMQGAGGTQQARKVKIPMSARSTLIDQCRFWGEHRLRDQRLDRGIGQPQRAVPPHSSWCTQCVGLRDHLQAHQLRKRAGG